jgi:hypothetical protein
MKKTLIATVMGVAMMMAIPFAQAQEHRYYDAAHRDYHVWNEGEARAYRHWVVEERHERYREWGRASRAQQRAYWAWRHEHSDWRQGLSGPRTAS